MSATSTFSIQAVETRSIQHCNRWNKDTATIVQRSLYITTIFLDKLRPPQNLYRPNREVGSCDTNMVQPDLVAPIVGNVHRKSTSTLKTKGRSQRWFRQTGPISELKFSEAGGMIHLKKALCLLGKHLRESSASSYEFGVV